MSKCIQEGEVVTLVLADDHAVVRKGLLAFFETTGDIRVVATATNGAEAVEAVQKHEPMVVLLDLLMPDQDAVTTIGRMRETSPDSRVIILTSHEGDEYVADVLRAGALSYVLKDVGPDELIAVVRKAAKGQGILNDRLAKSLLDASKKENRQLHDRLTSREKEVLRLIATGATNIDIAGQLFISETTVKSHVSSILGKLYLSDRTKLAVYAWEQGLIR